MKAKKQAKSPAPPPTFQRELYVRTDNPTKFDLLTQELTVEEARRLVILLQEELKSCNVANRPTLFDNQANLFASSDDGSVFTSTINDEEEYNAARAAFSLDSGSMLSVIGAVMNYHADQESLNILVHEDVMRKHAKSYLTFTGQFASLIAKQTHDFLKIRVVYSRERKQCGIFCRKSDFDLSVTFRGQLMSLLTKSGASEIRIPKEQIPETYRLYPSTLTAFVRKRMPDHEVNLEKTKTEFVITIKNK